jgi:hypothetical protein
VSISRGSDEKTVLISRKDAVAEGKDKKARAKAAKHAKDGDARPGLWDPLPITVPTYVSKPLAPRTVRTIDLSAPDVTTSGRQSVPVTADAPEETVAEVGEAQEQTGGSHAASA